MSRAPDETTTAYVVAAQVLAAAAVRQLLALEGDDPDVGSVVVVGQADGAVEVTLCNAAGIPLGGYSL